MEQCLTNILKKSWCDITAKQCENKDKSLKRKHIATINHKGKSENDRLFFFKFIFSEFYGMIRVRPTFAI